MIAFARQHARTFTSTPTCKQKCMRRSRSIGQPFEKFVFAPMDHSVPMWMCLTRISMKRSLECLVRCTGLVSFFIFSLLYFIFFLRITHTFTHYIYISTNLHTDSTYQTVLIHTLFSFFPLDRCQRKLNKNPLFYIPCV